MENRANSHFGDLFFALFLLSAWTTGALTCAAPLGGQAPSLRTDASQSLNAPVEVPKFEVATIKPGIDDGRFSLQFTRMASLS